MTDFKFECPHCANVLEAPASEAGSSADCPDCGAGITIPQPPQRKQRKKAAGKLKPRARGSRPGPRAGGAQVAGQRAPRTPSYGTPPIKLGVVYFLHIVQTVVMFSMGVGGGITMMVAKVPPENKSMAIMFGLIFILIGFLLGGFFLWVTIGLTQRKRLAHRFACGLSRLYLRSPLFFLGLWALNQLGQDAVFDAFGIEDE